jgi:hypothetical protein
MVAFLCLHKFVSIPFGMKKNIGFFRLVALLLIPTALPAQATKNLPAAADQTIGIRIPPMLGKIPLFSR